MKKLISFIAVLAVVSALFVSCEKDEETLSNSVKIEGTFTIGEKTYTNPTFNLGEPEAHIGYLVNYGIAKEYNGIYIEHAEDVDLGDNVELEYYFQIYSAQVGESTMSSEFEIYLNLPVKESGLYIYSNNASVNVTKIGDVGGYIEGTYEGDFYYDDKKAEAPFFLKGKFKVKRINAPDIY